MWTEKENSLYGEFIFEDFNAAFDFMTEVAKIAEEQNHHPNWSNVFNKVNIRLTTHDAGNIITDKDRKLAASIEEVFIRLNSK